MNLFELKSSLEKTAGQLADQEQFLLPVLAERAKIAAENFPSDTTLVSLAGILSQQAEKKLLISRGELKKLYTTLCSGPNKFAVLFESELGVKTAEPKNMVKHSPNDDVDLFKLNVDPHLKNTYAALLGDGEYKPYTEKAAKSAEDNCKFELNSLLPPKKVEAVAGNKFAIICKATYETPCGDTHVVIPIEVKGERALMPELFLTTAGFKEITKEALSTYIKDVAGKPLKLDVQGLLTAIASAKEVKPLSETDEIIAKAKLAKAGKADNLFSSNQPLRFAMEEPIPDIQPPQFEVSEEMKSFAKRLESPAGAAEFTLGKQVVELSRKALQTTLADLGYRFAKIAIADHNKQTIFYAVNVDGKTGFNVPMKVKAGRVNLPEIAVADGKIFPFSQEGLSQLMNNVSDIHALANTSSVSELRSDELVNMVRKAAVEGNMDKAKDALNVLSSRNDVVNYTIAASALIDGLASGPSMAKQASTKCSNIIKSSSSIHPVCGHLNLPLHKVYQDEHGCCLPLYRKNAAPAETASFMFGKMFWSK